MENKFIPKGSRIIIVLLNLAFFSSYSQTYQWANSGISPGFEYGNDIIADDSGNVYCTGQLEYTATFGTNNLASHGKHDIMIAKYSSGGVLRWVHNAGGTSGDVGWGIGVDAARNSYITGEFELTAVFDANDSISTYGANDIFFAKYDPNGNFILAKHYGGTSDDKGKALVVDPSGYVYLTGYFTGTSTFGSFSLTSSNGSNDMFLIKTDLSGNPIWAKKAGGTQEDRGRGIALDNSGNLYVAGTFTTSANFSGINVSAAGRNSAFLAKYDTSGTVLWVRTAGGCCDTTRSNSVTVDELGNAYVAGYFKDTTYFGTHQLISGGSMDVYVAKYDPNGNVLWAYSGGGPYEDMGNDLSYDARHHLLYVTGQIDDHGYFDSVYIGAAGNRDAFVVTYDTAGNVQWLKPCGGVQRDAGLSVTFDTTGNVYFSGEFTDTAFFGASTLYGYPLADFFVTKLSPAPAPQPTVAASALTIQRINCNDQRLTWINGNGSRRMVIARAGSPVSLFPFDETFYTASSTFGNGSDIGGGNFVVYDGTGSTATVTGLGLGVRYYFAVIEYNGSGLTSNYLTLGYPTANALANSFNLTSSASPATICAGSASTMSAHGAVTYQWFPSTGLSSTTDSVVSAHPATTTTYTVIGTNNIACQSLATLTVNVNPLPVVTFSNLSAVCENASSVTLLGGSPAGGTYSGTGVSGGIFNPVNSGPGTFVLTYTYTNGNNCTSTDTSAIIVRNLPVVTLSSFNSVCLDHAAFNLTGGTPSGGNYTGTGVSAGIFNPATAGPGTRTITYTYTDGNSCTSTANSSITVNSLPVVTMSALTAICIDAPAFTLSGGSPVGGTYSGSGVSGGNFTPATAGAGTTIITYSYADSNGCAGSATSSVLVHSLPVVTMNALPNPCSSIASITLTGGSPTGGAYSGTGVTSGHFYPATVGAGTYTITYNYTDVNGCSNSAQSAITVYANPTVTLAAFSPLCSNGAPVALSGGSPAGGTYIGTSVTSGMFNPAIGIGSYTISYTYTDIHGCNGNASKPINVKPFPSVSIGPDTTVCANAILHLSPGAGFTSYSWSTGATTNQIALDSSGIGLSTRAISVGVTNSFNCANRDTINVTFDLCSGVANPVVPELLVAVYPNPFSSTIMLVSENNISYTICDVAGRLLEHRENVSGTIHTGENLAPGAYYIEVRNHGGWKTFQVIKASRE